MKLPFPLHPKKYFNVFFGVECRDNWVTFFRATLQFKAYKGFVKWSWKLFGSTSGGFLQMARRTWICSCLFRGGVSNNWTKKQQQRDLQRWRSMVFFAGLIGWIAMMKMKTSTTCWWTLGCIRLDFLLVDLVDRDDGTVSDSLRWHVECVIYLTRHYKLQDHVFESCLMASSKSGEKLWRQNLLRAPMPEAMLCMKDVSTAKSIRKMWMHVMRWV